MLKRDLTVSRWLLCKIWMPGQMAKWYCLETPAADFSFWAMSNCRPVQAAGMGFLPTKELFGAVFLVQTALHYHA